MKKVHRADIQVLRTKEPAPLMSQRRGSGKIQNQRTGGSFSWVRCKIKKHKVNYQIKKKKKKKKN